MMACFSKTQHLQLPPVHGLGMQVRAGEAVQAASQRVEALHAALGAMASADPPGHAGEWSNNGMGNSQGRILASNCAIFQASTGLATEMRSQAGDRLDPS